MAAKAVKKEKTLAVEKAKISDAPQIHKLANHFAQKGVMLPRALSEIYENIRDFFVIRDGEKVIACCCSARILVRPGRGPGAGSG